MKQYNRIYSIFKGEGALGLEDIKKLFVRKIEAFAPQKFLEELEQKKKIQEEILEDFDEKISKELR